MSNLTWLHRGTSEIFPNQPASADPSENLERLIATADRPLRIKLGIDPTGTDLHLGHTIAMRKLRAFQDAGHTAILLIGDFTARIGDPTGKSDVRKQLTEADVQHNAATYLDQLKTVLDFDSPDRLEIRYNSEWLGQLDLGAILNLLSTMTVGQMLAKEGFDNRYSQGNPIFIHEFLYPLMQGYDSVALKADVELGGTDQKFNVAVGRDLQKHFGQAPQFGLLLPILNGTDGVQKMSKSLGNYVGLTEDPLTMYSKLEKTPDSLLNTYVELLTDLGLDALPENPRDRQKLLARTVTGQYHGAEAAEAAQQAAITLTQGNAASAEAVPEYSLAETTFPVKLFYLISAAGLCPTSSEARRQIQAGAVKIDGEKVLDEGMTIEAPAEILGKVLQVGKKKFIRLIP